MPHTNEEMRGKLFNLWKELRLEDKTSFEEIPAVIQLENFINQEISDLKKSIREEIEIVNKNYRCMACDEKVSNLSHTLQCKYKDEILSLKSLE